MRPSNGSDNPESVINRSDRIPKERWIERAKIAERKLSQVRDLCNLAPDGDNRVTREKILRVL